jgi:polynucleotide kinase-phosphatase
MTMVRDGAALCVPGNHDVKLMRKLQGRNVQMTHGLEQSVSQLEAETPAFRQEVVRFIDGLVSHYVLDDGKLVVAHAGLKEELQGRSSARVRDFALYGETTGETDEYGLPVRYNWASEYRGKAAVVYGHTPTTEGQWLNNTICIDTGCVFGGALTALRYPERELVSVPAARVYYEPVRPLQSEEPRLEDELLDVGDLLGKRIVHTRFGRTITIPEANAAAAFEVINRFGIDPRWLIYLPPTMAPCATSSRPDFLEYPDEAFHYFQQQGIESVVCEEKHMGSRAVIVVCRDEQAAQRRFGVANERGICYTRTGRRFFNDRAEEVLVLDRIATAAERAGLWQELASDWLCLDCEIMPWSLKARELISEQYAGVGAAARVALPTAVTALASATARGVETGSLLERFRERDELTANYVASYRRYSQPAASLADVRIAPFHLLASEGAVHSDQTHAWHMKTLQRLSIQDPGLIMTTNYREADLSNPSSREAAADWWLALTESGGEGMVVKPSTFLARGKGGLVQPAVKCRGREYLRIIYGPEYTAAESLARLRSRSLGRKSSLALSEFVLGLEALKRFVSFEAFWRVAQASLGVLALESEPVDPRL